MDDGKTNINIINEESALGFIKLWLDTDGSLYIVIKKGFEKDSSTSRKKRLILNNDKNLPIQVLSEDVVSKKIEERRISYHGSGKVIFHGMNLNSLNLDPILSLNQPLLFFVYSIPCIEKLQPLSTERPLSGQHFFINFIDRKEDSRLNFFFIIAPPSVAIPEEYSKSCIPLYFMHMFQLWIVISEDAELLRLSDICEKGDFINLAPPEGIHNNQLVSKNQSTLTYLHALFQTSEAIVLSPNGEGQIRIIYSVEMRIPPRIHITFSDTSFSFVIEKNTTVEARIKVKNKFGQTIKNADTINIVSIVLDAEIYDD